MGEEVLALRDHPRSRGVYSINFKHEGILDGSSPLARGLRRLRTLLCDMRGIIPARAGFTITSTRVTLSTTDHPRSRGVYSFCYADTDSMHGSSPLARGLRPAPPRQPSTSRIIPARAGFTRRGHRRRHLLGDHPRSRGVYRSGFPTPPIHPGSSPLARGLPQHPAARSPHAGIIPARAGFTGGPGYCEHHRQDHPRSRGVYQPNPVSLGQNYGSSPLARGLRCIRMADYTIERIIPARAGFTAARAGCSRSRRDHPRSRGVYTLGNATFRRREGSSPLARGLPDHSGPLLQAERDHPRSRGVYAVLDDIVRVVGGSSPLARGLLLVGSSHRGAERDHPRSRGVYGRSGAGGGPLAGSSPLARGLLRRTGVVHAHARIIPARAGFT